MGRVDCEPEIWRQLELAGLLSLAQVDEVLQVAFGWEDAHLHRFTAAVPFGRLRPVDGEIIEPPQWLPAQLCEEPTDLAEEDGSLGQLLAAGSGSAFCLPARTGQQPCLVQALVPLFRGDNSMRFRSPGHPVQSAGVVRTQLVPQTAQGRSARFPGAGSTSRAFLSPGGETTAGSCRCPFRSGEAARRKVRGPWTSPDRCTRPGCRPG